VKTFRSLRHRNYRLYFLGQLVSLAGSWTQMTALMWLAQELTGEAKWPALLIAAQIGPTVFLGAWGGALADRFPMRPLIALTQVGFLACSLILLTLHIVGGLRIETMLAVVCVHGLLQAIDLPARLAFVPTLVEREDLANAVSLNSLLFNLARAVGPAIAGLLLAHVSAAWCFAVNAISYFAVLLALCRIRVTEVPMPPRKLEARGGFAIIRRTPLLWTMIVVSGLVAVGGWPLLSLLPTFAVRILDSGKETYSMLLSSVGIGALIAALTTATLTNDRTRRYLLPLGLGLVVSALGAMPYLAIPWLASIGSGLFGFGMILFFSTGQSFVQLGIEDRDRGKVMGIWAMVLSAGVPMGNLVFGPLADAIGLRPVIAIQAGLVTLALGILIARRGTI
jgi:predicted MFS family arabinose efflux permease